MNFRDLMDIYNLRSKEMQIFFSVFFMPTGSAGLKGSSPIEWVVCEAEDLKGYPDEGTAFLFTQLSGR
jgi:hypothetical protein